MKSLNDWWLKSMKNWLVTHGLPPAPGNGSPFVRIWGCGSKPIGWMRPYGSGGGLWYGSAGRWYGDGGYPAGDGGTTAFERPGVDALGVVERALPPGVPGFSS